MYFKRSVLAPGYVAVLGAYLLLIGCAGTQEVAVLSGGHTPTAHLPGEMERATGQREADTMATAEGTFEKVVLEDDVALPMEMTIVPDGRIFFLERGGPIKMWNPDTDSTSLVGFLPVSTRLEFGLIGLTHDPDFEDNHWLYIFYTPPERDEPNRLSRFTFKNGEVDPKSEKVILEVPFQRKECCHTGGSLAFGPDGLLYLSTGDNTNPFASSGFAPIDERPGREPWDAQRTSGNTNSLSGKILRIRPTDAGGYEVPEGNLFAEGEEGRPEIYVMGNRNPYRISVDQETGWLYWGEVGPDAGAPEEDRGPAGHDEINQAREAGNYGWPMFVGNNKPYHDYDFETEESGSTFDPSAPVNDSPNNIGARVLPPAQPAFIWYPYGPSEAFPAVGTGGRTAMAGPVYHYDEETADAQALPQYYDGSLFIYEWARNWIKHVKLDEDGEVLTIDPFLPEIEFTRPMDMEIGPDGHLYVMEYGTTWEYNENAQLVRLDYHGTTKRAPVAEVEAVPETGPIGMTVRFSARGSKSRNLQRLNYKWVYPSRRDRDESLDFAWDFDGDGEVDSREKNPVYMYEQAGNYTATLTVMDAEGMASKQEVAISVGNTVPSVELTWPVQGGIFDYGSSVPYTVRVSDPEDASIAAQRVIVQPYLKRDDHRIALEKQRGAEGTLRIMRSKKYPYEPQDDLVAVIDAGYTDAGASDVEPLTALDKVLLQPRRKEAEFAREVEGASREGGDGRTFLQVKDGNYAAYRPINLANITALTFMVKPEASGRIEVRLDDPEGELLAEAEVDSNAVGFQALAREGQSMAADETQQGGPQDADRGWGHITVPIEDPGGTHTLYLVFRGESDDVLLKLDRVTFEGPGMMKQPPSSE